MRRQLFNELYAPKGEGVAHVTQVLHLNSLVSSCPKDVSCPILFPSGEGPDITPG